MGANQRTLPAPLLEDPDLSDRELTASDVALYISPDRYGMFMDALTDTGRDGELGDDEVFWDAADGDDGEGDGEGAIYGAEDVYDRWTLLDWASYNGSPKIKRLVLLKGVDPKHLDGIKLEDSPTLLPVSPFEAAVLVALVWGRPCSFGSCRRCWQTGYIMMVPGFLQRCFPFFRSLRFLGVTFPGREATLQETEHEK